jgi:hypothetical protein
MAVANLKMCPEDFDDEHEYRYQEIWWLTKRTELTRERTDFVAYGNEAELAHTYGDVVLTASVGGHGNRRFRPHHVSCPESSPSLQVWADLKLTVQVEGDSYLGLFLPTNSINVFANDSPLAGKAGPKLTSQVIKDRIDQEAETNVALIVLPGPSSETGVTLLSILAFFWNPSQKRLWASCRPAKFSSDARPQLL